MNNTSRLRWHTRASVIIRSILMSSNSIIVPLILFLKHILIVIFLTTVSILSISIIKWLLLLLLLLLLLNTRVIPISRLKLGLIRRFSWRNRPVTRISYRFSFLFSLPLMLSITLFNFFLKFAFLLFIKSIPSAS